MISSFTDDADEFDEEFGIMASPRSAATEEQVSGNIFGSYP